MYTTCTFNCRSTCVCVCVVIEHFDQLKMKLVYIYIYCKDSVNTEHSKGFNVYMYIAQLNMDIVCVHTHCTCLYIYNVCVSNCVQLYNYVCVHVHTVCSVHVHMQFPVLTLTPFLKVLKSKVCSESPAQLSRSTTSRRVSRRDVTLSCIPL